MQTALHPPVRDKPDFVLAFSRIFTGVLFIFSGLIKANDPIGFGYKLQEYFEVFRLTFLNNTATELAIVICSLEMLLGALLLLGIWRTQVAWGLLLLILFFTFLTFYSAFFEVVTSCGCFGDAISLTPWQSFGKDLILLVLIGVIFYHRRTIRPLITDAYTRTITTVLLAVLSLGIGIYTYNFLPFIDFLPYKTGNNLPQLMRMPPGQKPDEYELTYVLVHAETGEKKTVTDKQYIAQELWTDKNWEIQGEPAKRLLKKGYQVPISDLRITDALDVDYTAELIENPFHNLVIVAWDISRADLHALRKLNEETARLADEYRIRSVLLTASSAQTTDAIIADAAPALEVFYADDVPLKSMVRANPGILLLKDGTVLDKWHHHTFPGADILIEQYLNKADD